MTAKGFALSSADTVRVAKEVTLSCAMRATQTETDWIPGMAFFSGLGERVT